MSCTSENRTPAKQAQQGGKVVKVESILSLAPKLRIINDKGEIKVDSTMGSKENVLSYEKKNWKEWCVLHDKEEKGIHTVEVENTSFTGEDGCELLWKLNLTPNTELELKQRAGKIEGRGSLFDLKIQQAAGKLSWIDSDMPIQVEMAAGKVEWQAQSWPKKQSSSIEVAAGSVLVKSPKNATVVTKISNAIGKEKNEFEKSQKDFHKLEIEVATGKAQHISIK